MSVTPDSLKLVHPEFSSTDANRAQLFIDRASRFVSQDAWGARADDGVIELACHMLKVADGQGGATPGAPTSDHVGDVSTSYQVGGDKRWDSELGSTSYGRTYMQLRRLIFADRVV